MHAASGPPSGTTDRGVGRYLGAVVDRGIAFIELLVGAFDDESAIGIAADALELAIEALTFLAYAEKEIGGRFAFYGDEMLAA